MKRAKCMGVHHFWKFDSKSRFSEANITKLQIKKFIDKNINKNNNLEFSKIFINFRALANVIHFWDDFLDKMSAYADKNQVHSLCVGGHFI